MMTGGVTSAGLQDPRIAAPTIGIASITALRHAQSDGYDMVMPVRPAQAINAHFRHIQLLPDSRLKDGVPLYKLKILDALIDNPAPGGSAPGVSGTLTGKVGRAEAVDGLIAGIMDGLRAEEGAAARGMGSSAYRAGFLPLPGAFVDLVA
jgi:hypothetical protein